MAAGNIGGIMIKEKIYICTVKEDKSNPKRVCLATELFRDRFDVLWFGMWRPFFRHQLESVRVARVVEDDEQEVTK
jgi:hypothetical protein